jgi:hypothetical protein
MSTPLEYLKKVLLQRSRSPKKTDNVVCQPNPKRFDYRVALLRERYMLSINALEKEDVIHEFMYCPPVTPPNTIKGPSPAIPMKESYILSPKQPADFKVNTDTRDELTNQPEPSP